MEIELISSEVQRSPRQIFPNDSSVGLSLRTRLDCILLRLIIFLFLHHRIFSNETHANNPERYRLRSHTNINHITPVLKSLHWKKVPQRTRYKMIYMYLTHIALQIFKPFCIHLLLTIQPP